MKLNRHVSLCVVAVAGIGAAASIASAQSTTTAPSTDTTTTAPAGGHHWHGHHRGGFLLGMTLRATKQLNLTADQQASIKQILSNARAQAKAAHASGGGTRSLVSPDPPAPLWPGP